MLARLVIGLALALGLVAADAAADSAPAQARTFKGRTAQGHRIVIAVKGRMLKIELFDVDLRCRDGSTLQLEEGGFLWTRTKPDGGFRDAQFGKTDGVYFRGRVGERRIRGKLRVTDKERRGPKCATRWIAFNATPR